MSFESFIALRYIRARQKQAFISVISLISILGVGIGVAALIVVLGVMNGMSTDLRDKILGVNAHVLVGSIDSSLPDYRTVAEKVRKVEGVTGVMPFVYSEVMLSSRRSVKGVVLRGVDARGAQEVLTLDKDMVEGSLADLEGYGPKGGPGGIVVGKELADRLGLRRGSIVNALTPSGMKTAAGFKPSIKPLRVVAIFRTGMYEYDSSLAYMNIADAQKMLGYTGDIVNGVELRVDDVEKADLIAKDVGTLLGGYPYYVRDWKEMNANLYAALKLEKLGITIILVMIVLVGTFSIVTTLVMLVMEKTRDIAILMSMGATRRSIRKIFMLQGMIIGFAGTAAGFVLGLTLCFLLEKYQFVQLPKGIYSLDHLPVLLYWTDLAAIGGGALLLCFLATIYPARQAAKLMPAEALRYE